YWNQGIMTAVIKQFYQHIFQVTKMIRLEALVFQNNLASCRVLEKAGFNKEGYLKKAYQKENKFIDAWLYARIKDDEK
ncbi:MAG: GNAT family N-acetyltransferase, partial [Saprospiraceae bacterium]|nr:GNAT family N-acetyltransferase [Saprospiraceae bacterium]